MNPTVHATQFGWMPDGAPVQLFTLTNAHGCIARVTNYGATVTELHLPDRAGRLGDVVLGYDNLEQYLGGAHYFGSTIGRVANRIAGGRFILDGEVFTLACNNGPNHLHGGVRGFDKVLWHGEPLPGLGAAVRFTHISPDGDEGYPGRLDVSVVMILTDLNELGMAYTATTDLATPVNLTSHPYFNFSGHGDILGHELMIASETYIAIDETLIPTGEIRPVKGTPLDFTQAAPIGARFDQLAGSPVGYDHTFAINGDGKSMALAARVFDPQSGRAMEVTTTQPGMHLYTANFFDSGLIGKRGIAYPRYGGFSLEAQHFPDSVNQPAFPNTILRPGEIYRQRTVYRFGAV